MWNTNLRFHRSPEPSLDSQSLSLKKCPHVEIQSLTVDLPEISFLHISRAWDYQVFFFFFFSIWALILHYAFKTAMLPRNIYKWLGTGSLGCQRPHLLFCSLIDLVSSGHKEREGSLTFSLPRG